MTKMKNQKLKRKGRLACTTTQAHAKAQRCQYVITSECEAIQPIEKDVNRHKSTGTNSCNHLITQSLSHLITSKAAAFTLAEVLITLAVIGIVAALT